MMFKVLFLLSDFDSEYSIKEVNALIAERYSNEIVTELMTTYDVDNSKEKLCECIEIMKDSDLIFIALHGSVGYFKEFNNIMNECSGKKKIFFYSSMEDENREVFLKLGISKEEYFKISSYYRMGGKENYYNMLLYMATVFGNKKYEYNAPKPPRWEGIYHYSKIIDDEQEYLKKIKISGKPVVGVLFYSTCIQNDNTEAIDYLIKVIEEYGGIALAIYTSTAPDASIGIRGIDWVIDNLLMADRKPVVDVVINTMGFSQSILGNPGDGQDVVTDSVFEKLGVPVLQAFTSYQSYEGWKKSLKGIDNMSLPSSVYQPEFDGQLITSIFCYCEVVKDEIGDKLVFKPIKERIRKITRLALNWASLRNKSNKDKKIAIIFHNMPPRNDMIGCAHGLDSPRSVYNMVNSLKDIGVYTEYDFEDGDEIINRIIDAVSNDNRWLTVDRVVEKSIDIIKKEQYKGWFEKFPKIVQNKMEHDWGEAPGEFMVYDENMPVPGILNGNIFIGLQPARGYEEKADEIYHSTDIVCPHQYIAYYKWIKNVFKADVIVHVGTHGTLEWLPGKQVALSEECYSDICIDDIPHIYPYIIDVPGEGTQAKRRSYCAIIDYLIPSLMKSGSYDYIEELDELIKQYYHALQGDSGKLFHIEKEIIDLAIENNLNIDLKLEKKDMKENFEDFIEKLHGWIDEIKGSLVKDGLHIFGEVPKDERFDNLVVALLRIRNGNTPSLMEAVCNGYGLDYEYLKDNPYELDKTGKTNIMLFDELDELSSRVIYGFGKNNYDVNKIDDVLQKTIPEYDENNFSSLKEVLIFASQVVKEKLENTTDEIKYFIEGTKGNFVPPGGSGCPTRGNISILPTGRNFYSIDPTKVPSRASYEVGKQLGDDLLNRYLEEEGKYPESVAIVVYSGETMKTYGDDISEILYLMGLKPIWLNDTDKVVGIEVIPLEKLKRPRIDVTLRISGLFRDTFPNLIEIVEEAVNTVAFLDEDVEDNYIRKHVLNDIEELIAKGINFEEAKEESLMRIFGCPPGNYGAGVDILINSKNWEDVTDLGDVYTLWGGHAYGKNIHGKKVKEVFARRLSNIDVTVKNESSMEIDMLDSDDFYNYHGGLIAAVRTHSGKKPRAYCADASDPSRTKLKDVNEETARIIRARILNPKWFEGLKEHGYRGAQEISGMIDYVFGWDATSDVIENWMYEEISETYLFNDERREWIKSVNPWSVHNMVERLLEAYQRGMWKAKDKSIEKLRKLYVDIEGNIEEHL